MKQAILFFSKGAPEYKQGGPVWQLMGNVVDKFSKVINELPNDTRWTITIKEYREQRSLRQNAYMWGVVYKIISDHTGYTDKEVDYLMREQFLAYTKNGHTFVPSTTELNTKEMEEYLAQVRQFASDPDGAINCYIPLPNETHWTDL